jgi:hypothetical protein
MAPCLIARDTRQVKLALKLLHERRRGPASPVAGYVAQLPDSFETPLHWDDAALADLQYPHIVAEVCKAGLRFFGFWWRVRWVSPAKIFPAVAADAWLAVRHRGACFLTPRTRGAALGVLGLRGSDGAAPGAEATAGRGGGGGLRSYCESRNLHLKGLMSTSSGSCTAVVKGGEAAGDEAAVARGADHVKPQLWHFGRGDRLGA